MSSMSYKRRSNISIYINQTIEVKEKKTILELNIMYDIVASNNL